MSARMTKPRGVSLRQWLHYFTGDRRKESEALADSVKENLAEDGTADQVADGGPKSSSERSGRDSPEPVESAIRDAAAEAVRDAHGDSGVREADPPADDIASPLDVAKKIDQAGDGTTRENSLPQVERDAI